MRTLKLTARLPFLFLCLAAAGAGAQTGFFLKQALRRGVPHNGSAARFDDLGLYLFPTEEEAQAFASGYH